MSVSSQSSQIRPKTAEEARVLMNLAIESGDFEGAKVLAREVTSLENYETELDLAKTVHDYYSHKQLLSDTMNRNYRGFEQQIDVARANSQEFFQKQFVALKASQEQELDDLLRKWDDARVEAIGDADAEYEQTMTTAKLLASRMKFDDAIKIKTAAEAKRRTRSKRKTRDMDLQFNKQCNLLLARQQSMIDALAERKNAEMTLFDSLLDAAHEEALDSFVKNNAQAVIDIATRFPVDSAIPKSLQMQTVRGKPMQPRLAKGDVTPDRAYLKRMSEIDRTIGFPLKVGVGKADTANQMHSSLSMNESTEVTELSLTRSPLR